MSATRIEGEVGTGDVPALSQVVRHVAVGCVRLVVVWGLLELRHTLVEMMMQRSVCIISKNVCICSGGGGGGGVGGCARAPARVCVCFCVRAMCSYEMRRHK